MQTESTLRFVLNGVVETISQADPTMTLLQFVRAQKQLTGTKEGCAEGDCGACTVVIAEAHQGRIRLRSINACIQLLGMLHGKAVFTVEALQQVSGARLHPVQQAMVEYHGSQCGFCTPGFVMSLFALFKTSARPDRKQINQALSGNLCRCTGYRPIIQAAHQMADFSTAKHWLTQAGRSAQCDNDEQALLDQLAQLDSANGKTLHLQQPGRQFYAPRTEQDLLTLLQQHAQATLVAGNTDVGLWINKQLRELALLISIAGVKTLHQIESSENTISIAAAVPLSDAFDALQGYFPQLTDFFARFASQPVRNAGTLVGNIANGSPIGDLPPLLLALSARVELQSATGRRELKLQDFYQGYQQKDLRAGELVRAVHIPLPDPETVVMAYKVSKRRDQDISAVCAAFALTLDDNDRVQHIRIGFGGMAATPQRAYKTEQALIGATWREALVQQALPALHEDFSPLSDLRASAQYRLDVAANLLRRFYHESMRIDCGTIISLDDIDEVSL